MISPYIIHERPYNDKKKYLVLFSKERGIDSLSVSNKLRLHYFNRYQTVLKRNRLSLQDPIEHLPPLIGKKLYSALYLNELIYRFCKPSDPHPELFDQYVLSLSLLRDKADVSIVLRHFELTLLSTCGYGIDIAHIQSPYVSFNKHQGFIGTQTPEGNSIALFHLRQMIQELKPSPEVKYFFRHILNTLLSSSLKSRLFYDKIA